MSDFEREFSQFSTSPAVPPANIAHSPSANDSEDFEQLDPYSAHEDYPLGLSSRNTAYSEELTKSSPSASPLGHYSTDRPLMTLGLEAETNSAEEDNDSQSPMVMVGGGVGDSLRETKQDYDKLEDFLGGLTSDGKTSQYEGDISPVPTPEPKPQVKSEELDFLKDYKPQQPTAPALEDFYGESITPAAQLPKKEETPIKPPSPVKIKEEPVKVKEPTTISTQRIQEVSSSKDQIHGSWFNTNNWDPRVVELVYWRDVKKSAIVFGVSLLVLLSLSYCSLISVGAYLSLALLTITLTFRVYKNILQAVQKSGEGHPFKEFLEMDLSLPQDKVQDVTDIIVRRVNAIIVHLRRLFLVEDLVDSIKFGLVLWCLTYIGAWFNGMTLLILAFLSVFTVPKVYETHKEQIDHYVGIASTQIKELVEKVKAKIPVGKKPKEQ